MPTPDDPHATGPTDPPPPRPEPLDTSGRHPLPRYATPVVLLGMCGVVGMQARGLWTDWWQMTREIDQADRSTIISFPNTFPVVSLADRPAAWFRTEGNNSYIWAGWDRNSSHHWFAFKPGDVDRARITAPVGRNVIPAVVDPLVEVGGGSIWERLPSRTRVIGLTLGGRPSAYPVPMMAKVCLVNDAIDDRSILVLANPGPPEKTSVSVFDSTNGGRRVSLAAGGFLLDGRPVLYDHETESLWYERDTGLEAVGGKRKGTQLPLLAHPATLSWGEWKVQNPRGRLIVGSRSAPEKH